VSSHRHRLFFYETTVVRSSFSHAASRECPGLRAPFCQLRPPLASPRTDRIFSCKRRRWHIGLSPPYRAGTARGCFSPFPSARRMMRNRQQPKLEESLFLPFSFTRQEHRCRSAPPPKPVLSDSPSSFPRKRNGSTPNSRASRESSCFANSLYRASVPPRIQLIHDSLTPLFVVRRDSDRSSPLPFSSFSFYV